MFVQLMSPLSATLLIIILSLQLLMTSSVTQATAINRKKVRACYFTNWSHYRSNARFTPGDIDPFICTHILYAFAYVNENTDTVRTVEWNDEQLYKEVIALKDLNPELNVLLAVGGATHGTAKFEAVARSETKTKRFAKNAATYLRKYGFDGLDVDWEFPNQNTKDDFQRFIKLIAEEFLDESVTSDRNKLELTVAVSGDPATTETIYRPSQIASSVDYVLIMAYDLWGPWMSTLGHHSPLYHVIPGDREQGRFSSDAVVRAWEEGGAGKDRLVMGMATYGRTGILQSSQKNQPGDSWTQQAAPAGQYTLAPGFLAYYEVCDKLKAADWNEVYLETAMVPYAWNSGSLEYICYDNPRSFHSKAEYIMTRELAGAMFWNLDFDDFSGQFCGSGKYPLLSTVKDVFDRPDSNDGQSSDQTTTTIGTASTAATTTTTTATPKTTTTTPTTTTTTSTTTTTTKAPADSGAGCDPFTCPTDNGYFSDPANCTNFYQCANGDPNHHNCPPGLEFNPAYNYCDWPYNVQCVATC